MGGLSNCWVVRARLLCGLFCLLRVARAVGVLLTVFAMMKPGLTMSVDTVTGRPFMAIRVVFLAMARTMVKPLKCGSRV
jgi:hypothetical protein